MFRGVYSATSGMIASQRKQEALTNNLSNAQTPGYKKDDTVLRAFPDLLIERIRDQQKPPISGMPSLPGKAKLGTLYSAVYAQEAIPAFRQGDIQETGRPIDFAIVDQDLINPETGAKGHLFFTVENENGDLRYTRNGQFSINPAGFLTTGNGHYVLDNQGARIQFTDVNITLEDLQVNANGVIYTQTPQGFAPIGTIGLAYTEAPERFKKEGNGLLNWVAGAEGAGQPQALENAVGANFTLLQGYIERSNVDPTQTMTDMLATYRQYEANQKVLQAYDRSIEKLVTEVGRIG